MLIVPKEKVILQSTNAENDESIEAYNNTKNYALDAVVKANNNIYKSLKASNLGNTPKEEKTSLEWEYLGKTNAYKMFDDYINTITKNNENITCEFLVDDIDTLAFFNLEALNVEVWLFSSQGIELFYQKKEAYKRYVYNWLDWTIQKPIFEKILYFKGLPITLGCRLKIKINNPNSEAKCGFFMCGRSLDLGLTLIDPKPTSSIRNLVSKEKINEDLTVFKNSKLYKRVVLNVLVDSGRISDIQNILEMYSLTPCLFVGVEGSDEYNALTVFGYYKDFDKPIGLNKTSYQIEIEGII